MGRCPIQLQQSSIFYSGHDNHVFIILPYLKFTTEHMNKMALLSNVHKGQQASLQLKKIEYNVQKKI
jgi:hypothetical protein